MERKRVHFSLKRSSIVALLLAALTLLLSPGTPGAPLLVAGVLGLVMLRPAKIHLKTASERGVVQDEAWDAGADCANGADDS